MSEAWKSYPRAPSSGAHLCNNRDVPDPGTLGVEPGGFPILMVMSGDKLRAYVNACPHQFLPLDYRSDQVLSVDQLVLRCSNHSAGFSAETGEGMDGHGQGCWLDPVPVRIDADGDVTIA